ncbi:translational activator for mitochondrial COX1 [Orbilia oligospora]|uniref:Translational activator for mitochondrial COX1 n=1 Tax=Orbilia oligospora TaxID=2813651 RepID=A0A7C8R5Y7_ORBOL|nr:translational activator for mitochondrial COX1 [Orbilia oligospora]
MMDGTEGTQCDQTPVTTLLNILVPKRFRSDDRPPDEQQTGPSLTRTTVDSRQHQGSLSIYLCESRTRSSNYAIAVDGHLLPMKSSRAVTATLRGCTSTGASVTDPARLTRILPRNALQCRTYSKSSRPLQSIFSFLNRNDPDKVPEPGFPVMQSHERRKERIKQVKESWKNPKPAKVPSVPMLSQTNLFHPLSESPIPEMREMGKRIQERAVCPVDVAHEVGKHQVKFECPDCGIPIYCCEDHWMDDYENHVLVCETLREINEDEHDLRSGREFPEFEYQLLEQEDDCLINFTNWDTFLYTREFEAVNDMRALRQVTKLLTYPVTVGSVIHELSPYNLNNRLTYEGLKSFAATRYSLHPVLSGSDGTLKGQKQIPPPMRIFVLGARGEASLPREVWAQLPFMFPRVNFHIAFIGPEVFLQRPRHLDWPPPPRSPGNPFGTLYERPAPRMKISSTNEYFHTLNKTGMFAPYDPYFDVFVLFHPGFSHPASATNWEETLPMLLETKCPVIVTGYTKEDMDNDVEWVNNTAKGEFDVLMEPGQNRFSSLRWNILETDPSGGLSQSNWGVWAFRGKRYETMQRVTTPDVIPL